MKTTFDLPDELVKEIKLLAIQEGKNLKDAVADLLRQGLNAAASGNGSAALADKVMLKRRKALTQKFVAGKWGVDSAGYEAARDADRSAAAKRAKAWRE